MISSLSELSRSMMIHANNIWMGTRSKKLWIFDLKIEIEDLNRSPSIQESMHRIPNQKFLGSKVISNIKHWKSLRSSL